MKPYTYLIRHRPTNRVYYGMRAANKVEPEQDLWQHYFTSSPGVQQLIEETGPDSFDVEIRRVFETKEQAVAWETRVLRRCKVLYDDRWINQNVAGYIVPTEESRKKISDFHKGRPKSSSHKDKISTALRGKSKPNSKNQTPEYKLLMSKLKSGSKNAMFGKHHSEETKAKIGALLSERIKGDNNPMRRVEWTEERRKAMGDRSRGTKWTAEAIESRSAKLRGQKREKLHCEHCDRDIAKGWFHRHGPACSQRPS